MSKQTTAPLSPHLQIWRWTITMAASIFQRATGVALYAGTTILTLWLASAAISDSAFATIQGFLGSPFGAIILIGYVWAISFHLLNGLRFLFWDAGYGFDKDTANKTGIGAFAGSLLLTVIVCFIGFGGGI